MADRCADSRFRPRCRTKLDEPNMKGSTVKMMIGQSRVRINSLASDIRLWSTSHDMEGCMRSVYEALQNQPQPGLGPAADRSMCERSKPKGEVVGTTHVGLVTGVTTCSCHGLRDAAGARGIQLELGNVGDFLPWAASRGHHRLSRGGAAQVACLIAEVSLEIEQEPAARWSSDN